MKKKSVDDFMRLPYTKLIKEFKDGTGHYYIGRILELDGCSSEGSTIDEMLVNLDEAMKLYLETAIDEGIKIPVPLEESSYSGRFNIRIPKSLHQRLVAEAKIEGVSLNQYALYKLAL